MKIISCAQSALVARGRKDSKHVPHAMLIAANASHATRRIRGFLYAGGRLIPTSN